MNMSLSTIARQSVNGHWEEERVRYRTASTAIVIDRKKEEVYLDKEKFDEYTHRQCDVIQRYVALRITQLNNQLAEATSSGDEERIKKAREELDGFIAKSQTWVQKSQEIKYRAMNIPPPTFMDVQGDGNPFKRYQELKFEYMKSIGAFNDASSTIKFSPTPPAITNGKKNGSNS
jgi:hypothetical protein